MHNERRCWLRPGHRIFYLCGAAGNDLGITINYLRETSSGAAGVGLGTTVKYLRRTTSAAAELELELI